MKRRMPSISVIALIGAIVLSTGCDTNDNNVPEVGGLDISPDQVTLEVGETEDFSVDVLDVSGDVIQDADVEIEWWSTDPDVFTVTDDGLARGEGVGEAKCMVEITSARFTGRDSAFVSVLLL